jgi:hypothetical protein
LLKANQPTSEQIRSVGTSSYTADTARDNEWSRKRHEKEERLANRLKQEGNWWAYAKGFMVSGPPSLCNYVTLTIQIFYPYLWPVRSTLLQMRAVFVGLCLLGENFINVLVPRQLGAITDALMSGNGERVPSIKLQHA